MSIDLLNDDGLELEEGDESVVAAAVRARW